MEFLCELCVKTKLFSLGLFAKLSEGKAKLFKSHVVLMCRMLMKLFSCLCAFHENGQKNLTHLTCKWFWKKLCNYWISFAYFTALLYSTPREHNSFFWLLFCCCFFVFLFFFCFYMHGGTLQNLSGS